jgi:alpha-glucosidase (family GH31 glycosyl hydrolase)
VPFFLSSDGYGLLVDGSTAVTFDIGRTVDDRWICRIPVDESGSVSFDLFTGSPDDIVRSMTAITGRPEPLPAWAHGLWMSSNEWNTQARVEREVALTHEHHIPATVLVIEAWSDESTFYVWNGARYQATPGSGRLTLNDFDFPADGPWPDPLAMTRRLHEQGIRLVLWQIPALKALDGPHPQQDADVAHAMEQQYVLSDEDGTPYRNPFFWFQNAFIPDFTNRAATDWWLSKRQYLLDEMGIDGFKTDGGEHLAGRGLRASDGRRGDELVNAYPNLYVGAYHRFTRRHRGGDTLTFSRAGHTGAGAYPAHWAGDENSTWEAYRRSIVAGLTAGLSGVIFWGWDLSGFSDDLPTTELYLRSAAMAAFCPIMQYHSEYNPSGPSLDRTPWNVATYNNNDERAISIFRHFSRIRMNLLPYIVQEAAYAAEQGTPLMRSLFLDHPDDPVAWRIEDQYRFGRSLLVAPIVEEGATSRTLYLPHGEWVDFWTGELMSGGRWISTDAPIDRIPVFARAGRVIPLRLGADAALGGDTGNSDSVTEGLSFWLAGPNGVGHWTDLNGASHETSFQSQSDGSLFVELPPFVMAVRILAAGKRTLTIGPSSDRQTVFLAPT